MATRLHLLSLRKFGKMRPLSHLDHACQSVEPPSPKRDSATKGRGIWLHDIHGSRQSYHLKVENCRCHQTFPSHTASFPGHLQCARLWLQPMPRSLQRDEVKWPSGVGESYPPWPSWSTRTTRSTRDSLPSAKDIIARLPVPPCPNCTKSKELKRWC